MPHEPSTSSPTAFDEYDPHHGGHHEHVIVPPFVLRSVLTFLLCFTILTVGIAQTEEWAMGYFHIDFPRWVNVVGAMTIAVVKAVLVMAYFMQLRFDTALNTVVMLFTFAAVGLFLFFTGLDLFTRDKVFDFKATYVVAGGTFEGSKPLVKVSRDKWLELWGPDRFAALEGHAHSHGSHGEAAPQGSSASRSRPKTGETDALLPAAPVPAEHGSDHAARSPGESHSPAPAAH